MVLVDADIPRSGSGTLLLTQVLPKYFLSPLPFKNAMTEQSCLSTNSNTREITVTSSTAGKVSVHHHLHFAGMKSILPIKFTLWHCICFQRTWALILQESVSGDSK